MFQDATPMIPVVDVLDAARWFKTHLGFEAVVAAEHHAYLKRDNAAIRLHRLNPDYDVDDPRCQETLYLDVDDVDEVYEAFKVRLDALPDGFFRSPFDRDYGQREFHVIYQNLLIFVGMPAQKDAK